MGSSGATRTALLGVLVALSACVPDAMERIPLRLSDGALDFLTPDSAWSRFVQPGVAYHYAWSPIGPWAVHLVEADLGGHCELGFDVLVAAAREHGPAGREPVSAMTARAGSRVVAAVNADFFTPEGTTVGAEVRDGVVRVAEARPTFAWKPGSPPWMGIAAVTAGSLEAGWSVDVTKGDGVTEAVGGFPDLIDGGERVGDLEVSARPSFAGARHPRTAIGYASATGRVWLVVVDGRQPPHSVGMTLPELAELFEALGADEALNLDGGGSSALVLGEHAVNRPSDATGERPVVNALALVRDPGGCLAAAPGG